MSNPEHTRRRTSTTATLKACSRSSTRAVTSPHSRPSWRMFAPRRWVSARFTGAIRPWRSPSWAPSGCSRLRAQPRRTDSARSNSTCSLSMTRCCCPSSAIGSAEPVTFIVAPPRPLTRKPAIVACVSGVRSVVVDHNEPWGRSSCVNTTSRAGDVFSIEMQSGDVIRVSADAFVLGSVALSDVRSVVHREAGTARRVPG